MTCLVLNPVQESPDQSAECLLLHGGGGWHPGLSLQSGSERTGLSPARITIIVVDDEEPALHITARMLREMGHNVIEAHSAHEALHRLRLLKDVRLVLADIAMPLMNGLQLAEIVTQDFPGVGVILMSGYASLLPKMGAWEGKYPLIMKPFTGEDLSRHIESTVRGEEN
jgi:DNA-binding NtrC family response regulator